MTLIVAHRGASAYDVENSLSAFRLAAAMGADGVELDIHVTADGVPVVHHDPVAGRYPIWRTALEELRRHRLANGEPIPTLAEALETIGHDLQVFIEVKGLAERHDRALLEVLAAGTAPKRYAVHSFDHRIVHRLRQQHPELSVGVLSTSYPIDPVRQARDAGAMRLWQQESLVDDALISACRAAEVLVYAWTVDESDRMRTLASLGVDAVCTNRPDFAREVLG